MVLLFSGQINKIALSASENEYIREELIRDQEQNILRTASKACRRFVTKSDDEWSLALGEFSRAIDLYTEEKGDFLPFAQMLIKRKLIDNFRYQSRRVIEISASPHLFEGNTYSEEDKEGICLRLADKSRESSDCSLKEEIRDVNEELKSYGFRFFDLTECSPRQDKTRAECKRAVRCMLEHEEMLVKLESTKKLPALELAAKSGVSRKTIDRYRKYVIMAVVILRGDYPHISEYLKFIGKEASE